MHNHCPFLAKRCLTRQKQVTKDPATFSFFKYSVHHNICMRLRLEKSSCYCSTNKFHCAQQHSNQSWHYWQPATTKRCGLCLLDFFRQQPRQSNIETPFGKLIFSRKWYKKKKLKEDKLKTNASFVGWWFHSAQETKRYGIKRSCSLCVKMKANTGTEAYLTSCQLLVDNHHILDTLCSVKKTAKSHIVKICLIVLHLLLALSSKFLCSGASLSSLLLHKHTHNQWKKQWL